MERGKKRRQQREIFLQKSLMWFTRTLEIDPENQPAHYNLALVYSELGKPEQASHHRQQHDLFRPDDHAIEIAVTRHRQNNPAADHAAAPFVIYDLNRSQAHGSNGAISPQASRSAPLTRNELTSP
jgi:tetratricopeptide (TPR) repeat protein